MSDGLTEYVIDWRATDEGNGAAALRMALRLVEDAVVEFECDLPVHDRIPTDARQAASVLLAVARKPNGLPPATGMLRVGDPAVWTAFIAFAPFAYDGSVWTSVGGGRPVVSFADEGESVVVRLDADQAAELQGRVSPAVLVPSREWRGRPRSSAR